MTNPTDGSRIPGFKMGLLRDLANTVGEGDDIRPVMACHWSEWMAEVVAQAEAIVQARDVAGG